MFKEIVKYYAIRCGVFPKRAASFPWGVDMFFDLARLPSLGGIHTIADIGANIGQSAVSFRRRFPTAEIHCFEPVVESYEKGIAATRRLAKIAWHPVAVSDRELGRYTHLI